MTGYVRMRTGEHTWGLKLPHKTASVGCKANQTGSQVACLRGVAYTYTVVKGQRRAMVGMVRTRSLRDSDVLQN